MAVSHRGAISFGLVHIPVGLYTATTDNDVKFNQLCKDDHSRVRQKKTCGHCGKEIQAKDIIKGYQYEKDKYVVIADEEFEKIKTEKDRSIQILQFIPLADIPPIYYDKTYHALPEAGGDKAFELLRTAMLEEEKVAVGRTVLGQKETLLAIIPTQTGMLIETMFYADEIKAIPKEPAKPELNQAEVDMAKTLIESMTKPWQPEVYKDKYQVRLKELIAQKIVGKEVVAAPEAGNNGGNIIDLMEALQASIDQATPPKKTRKKPAAKKAQ